MYPVLKSNVRLKRFSKSCWIYAPELGKDGHIPPCAAFTLSLMDGCWTTEELSLIVSTVYNSDAHICEELVQTVLQTYANCIGHNEQRTMQKAVKQRNNPQDFLFNGAVTPDDKERLETPNVIALALTRACNFKCIYCFNASEKERADELTGAEWLDVIEQARKLGVFQAYVTGGEPTLHPDLAQILYGLKEADLDFKFFTNGYRLQDDVLALLDGAGVQVSLDTADREMHRRLTGTDTFGNVVKNIERLVGKGITVSVKCVVTALNAENCADLYRLCADLGISQLSLEKFDVSSSGRGQVGLRVPDEQKRKIKLALADIETANTKLTLNLSDDIWRTPDDAVSCGAFRSSVILSASGDLIGCEKLVDVPEMIIGNIRNNTLAELWASPKIDHFITSTRHTEDEKCRNCGSYARCRTGCFAEKHYFGRPIFGADPRCEIEKERVL